MNPGRHVIVYLLLGLLLVGCGRPEPQPLSLGQAVWSDGEISRYRITNRDEARAGEAHYQLSAGGNSIDETGWTLARRLTDIGASEQLTVEIEGIGYRPVGSRLLRTDRQGAQVVVTAIERTQADITLTDRAGAKTYERTNVPSDIRDERTLPMLARTLPLADGYATRINSFLPVTGQTERAIVQVRDGGRIETPAGVFETWRVDIEIGDRTTQAWIAVEPPYPLVKMIDGRSQATFELTEFVTGN